MKLSTFAAAFCGLYFTATLPATDFAQTIGYTEANAPEAAPAIESVPVPADGKLPPFSLQEGELRIFHLYRPTGPGEVRLTGHGGTGTIQWSMVGEDNETYLFSSEAEAVGNIRVLWGWQFNSRPERLYFVFEGGPGGTQESELSIQSRFEMPPR